MMNDSSSRIAQIDQKDAYQICSGQSVVDLSTAVKELVENAMVESFTVFCCNLSAFIGCGG